MVSKSDPYFVGIISPLPEGVNILTPWVPLQLVAFGP